MCPIYEYYCETCKIYKEKFTKDTNCKKIDCDKCHGEMNRVIANTSFVLKGGCWAKDGYSRGKR